MSQYRVGEFEAPADEVARLGAQAQLIAAEERAALSAVGVPLAGQVGAGSVRGVEIGCGPGFFAEGIARAHPSVALLGMDIDPYVLKEAQTRLPVVRGDAAALPFADEQFDFVYSRLFLRHVQQPPAVLAGMIRLLKRGGCVAAIDCSDASLLLDPVPQGFAAVAAARRDWFERRGCSADMGHLLPRLFAGAGLAAVAVRTIMLTTSTVGAASFAQIVLVPFLQAAADVRAGDAQIAAARVAVDGWVREPGAYGSITLFVAGGRRE